eukprot:6629504-Prymnesium_polylepis.1
MLTGLAPATGSAAPPPVKSLWLSSPDEQRPVSGMEDGDATLHATRALDPAPLQPSPTLPAPAPPEALGGHAFPVGWKR